VSKIAKSPENIANEIITTLNVTCPGLSLQVGTVERKIVDAVAEAIAEAYVDNYLLGSLLDIDTKVGLELEQFVGIFGFGRTAGKQAQGVVTVKLGTASELDHQIPLGTTFYTKASVTSDGSPLYYAAKQAGVLVKGSYTVDIPVECTVAGVLGNVAPDSVAYVGTILGSSSVTNLAAMTGGTDDESDAALRARFKDTLMRNAAGTSDFYEALCQQNNTVARVKVIGPTVLERIQIEAPADALTLPVSADVKYTWPGSQSVFKSLGQPDEVFYFEGGDYTFTAGAVTPVLDRVESGDIVEGDILDVEYEYTPNCSRCRPASGITNKVDIFVDGQDPYQVTERTVITNTKLLSSSASPFWTSLFRRVGSTGDPQANNYFTRLSLTPLLKVPDVITQGSNVWERGVDYHVIMASNLYDNDQALLKGSPYEVAGIEWTSSGPGLGTELTLVYVYNRTPRILQAIMKEAKQICTDVLVHQADFTYIKPHLFVEYDRNYSIAATNTTIVGRLQTYFNYLGYGATITVSGMLLAVMQVIGVVNVKLIRTGDSGVTGDNHGLQLFDESTDITHYTVTDDDFKLNDNQLAQCLTPIIRRKPIL